MWPVAVPCATDNPCAHTLVVSAGTACCAALRPQGRGVLCIDPSPAHMLLWCVSHSCRVARWHAVGRLCGVTCVVLAGGELPLLLACLGLALAAAQQHTLTELFS